MLIENRTVRLVIVTLLVLLVIPLVAMLGMMMFGGGMAQMGGMQMGAGAMALCVIWTVLVAAALIFLIVLLVRGATGMRSPLPH